MSWKKKLFKVGKAAIVGGEKTGAAINKYNAWVDRRQVAEMKNLDKQVKRIELEDKRLRLREAKKKDPFTF